VLEVIDSLKKDGIIHYSGLGGTTAYEMANIIKLGNFDVVLTAFQYNLLLREAAIDIIPAAKERNMGIVIGSSLYHGALAKRYDDEVKDGAKWLSSPRRKQLLKLYEMLDETDMSIVEMSLRFLLSNPDISTALVGARSKEEIRSSVTIAEKGPLPEDVLKRLDEIAQMVPFRPYEEPYNMPFNKDYKGPGMIR
jgi:aryl-alcohol dehydrogenase-like predicted oxidoreductase